nr:metaxin-1 homolog isoform X1 [Onthophagus taurus]
MERGAPGTLYVFRGNYGLPSVDPKCLQLIFLLRIHAKHNIALKTCRFCTYPQLPYLNSNEKIYYTLQGITNAVHKMVLNGCDKTFSTLDKSRILAYKHLTHNVFSDTFDLHFWGYDRNNQHLIKQYGEGKHFPFRVIFARRMNRHVQRIVEDLTERDTLAEVLKVGNEAVDSYLEDLSKLLKDKKYLFGDKPSSLDALVCGYLAPIVILEFPNKILQNIVNNHKKIVKYVKMFLQEFGEEYEGVIPSEIPQKVESEKAPLGTVVIAGFIAVSVMVCYGLIHDIIKVN